MSSIHDFWKQLLTVTAHLHTNEDVLISLYRKSSILAAYLIMQTYRTSYTTFRFNGHLIL